MARLRQEAPLQLAVSVITEMEVEYGLARNPGLAPRVREAMRVYTLKSAGARAGTGQELPEIIDQDCDGLDFYAGPAFEVYSSPTSLSSISAVLKVSKSCPRGAGNRLRTFRPHNHRPRTAPRRTPEEPSNGSA